jgi:hypothetical protein
MRYWNKRIACSWPGMTIHFASICAMHYEIGRHIRCYISENEYNLSLKNCIIIQHH